MRLRGDPAAGDPGFTLVELTIALVILMMVSIALFLFLSTTLSSTSAVDWRATETDQAHQIAEELEGYLYQATCVSNASSTTSTTWATSGDLSSTCSPPGAADVIVQGTPSTITFYAPSTRSIGMPTAYTEYEVMLGNARHLGALTVYDAQVLNKATGGAFTMGTDVTSLGFSYFDALGANCAGTGSNQVPLSTSGTGTTNDITAVQFSVSIQAAGKAFPITYTTCVLMPNAM